MPRVKQNPRHATVRRRQKRISKLALRYNYLTDSETESDIQTGIGKANPRKEKSFTMSEFKILLKIPKKKKLYWKF